MKLHIHNFVVAEVRKVHPKECGPFYHTKYHYCVDKREIKEIVTKITDGREYFIFKAEHTSVGWAYSRGKRTFLKWEKKGVITMAKSMKKAALKGAVKGAVKGAAKGAMKKGSKKGC